MADGIRKNASVVWGQIKSSWGEWKSDVAVTLDYLKDAAKDKDVLEVLHKLNALRGDTHRLFFRMDRLWLYVLVVPEVAFVGALFGWWNWPLTWTGF